MIHQTIHPRAYHLLPNRIREVSPVKQALITNLRKSWNLQQSDQDKLLQYYLLKWEGNWLAQQLARTNSGNILQNNVVYKVEWHNCHPVDACASSQVMLSFRQVRHEYHTCNYVLVRIVAEQDSEE